MATRSVKKRLTAQPTIEGAGVHLKRGFGFDDVPEFDPFLMLDDFHTSNPDEYLPGFPWHPHRGIETITYLIEGLVEHGDSMGNRGTIGAGDVQWMTAGSGVVHQEMPKKSPTGTMWGFQFWANLPRDRKMMDPRYRDVKAATIPQVTLDNGVAIKIIAGTVNGTRGPVGDIVIDPEMLDVTVPAGQEYRHPVKDGHTAIAYVLTGEGRFGLLSDGKPAVGVPETVLLFERSGGEILARAEGLPLRFLLIAGKPLGEPVAWRGPIVMNTQEELAQAFREYRAGTFIRKK